MDKLHLQTFRLNVSVNVGSLNQKKGKALTTALKPFFSSGVVRSDNGAVILSEESTRKFVLVTAQQITYGQDDLSSGVDFEKMQQILNAVAEALLVEGATPSSVQIVANMQSDLSTMAQSLSFLSIDSSGLSGLSGVGLRFLFKRESAAWEMKIEPYIRDDSAWFIEAICGNADPVDISEVSKAAKVAYDVFEVEWSAFAARLLKGVGNLERREEA